MKLVNYNLVTDAITKYVSVYYRYPYNQDTHSCLRDSLSSGQLNSKLRALQLVSQHTWWPRKAYFIGHWHGLLPRLFYTHNLVSVASGCELDKFWCEFSTHVNDDWSWTTEHRDATTIDTLSEYSLVVNTSCEHMTDDWLNALTPGQLICAQSTDYEHSTHKNTVKSIDEFVAKFDGYKILESHTEKHEIYSRYTVVALLPSPSIEDTDQTEI